MAWWAPGQHLLLSSSSSALLLVVSIVIILPPPSSLLPVVIIVSIVARCHHCQHCCHQCQNGFDAIHWIVSRLDRTLFANGKHSLAIQQPHPLTSLCTTLVWWSSHLHRKYFNPLHFKFISIAWLEIWFDDRAMNTCLVFDFAKFAFINYQFPPRWAPTAPEYPNDFVRNR